MPANNIGNANRPVATPAGTGRNAKASRTAIRWLVYWTLGLLATLRYDMYRRGINPTNWIPMAITLLVFLIVGIAYLRSTTPKERRNDAVRKLTDPGYE
jgi:hypothetical protein